MSKIEIANRGEKPVRVVVTGESEDAGSEEGDGKKGKRAKKGEAKSVEHILAANDRVTFEYAEGGAIEVADVE